MKPLVIRCAMGVPELSYFEAAQGLVRKGGGLPGR